MSEPFTSYGPFVLRIIFHGCLLGLYPLIIVYLVIGAVYTWPIVGTIIAGFVATTLIFSLLLLYAKCLRYRSLPVSILLILVFSDYMTLKRRPPPTLATIADFLLTGTLVPTMWGELCLNNLSSSLLTIVKYSQAYPSSTRTLTAIG